MRSDEFVLEADNGRLIIGPLYRPEGVEGDLYLPLNMEQPVPLERDDEQPWDIGVGMDLSVTQVEALARHLNNLLAAHYAT